MSDSLEASMMKRIGELKAENARLKAEVERVGAENSHLHNGIYSLSLNVGQLKDEVERLTKANKWLLGQGNHMCDSLEESGKDECLTQSWREITAKEVQP